MNIIRVVYILIFVLKNKIVSMLFSNVVPILKYFIKREFE